MNQQEFIKNFEGINHSFTKAGLQALYSYANNSTLNIKWIESDFHELALSCREISESQKKDLIQDGIDKCNFHKKNGIIFLVN